MSELVILTPLDEFAKFMQVMWPAVLILIVFGIVLIIIQCRDIYGYYATKPDLIICEKCFAVNLKQKTCNYCGGNLLRKNK